MLAENTQGPANLISLPQPEELDVICPDEIFRMVNECKYIINKINKHVELGFDSTGRLSDPEKQQQHDAIEHDAVMENALLLR